MARGMAEGEVEIGFGQDAKTRAIVRSFLPRFCREPLTRAFFHHSFEWT